jgi:4-amino-4-deoxy-L-arabinose transferase-like glycosyltransferase
MDSRRWGFWIWASAALIAGLVLRLWFARHMALIAGDSLMYGDIAKNLLQHRIYGFTESGPAPGSIEIRPTLIRLPGYPIFLAACFRIFGMEHYTAVLYVQVAADLVTCCLVSALGARLFGSGAALVVLWLAAMCPFTASYVAAPLTETLVLTSIALAFYAFARWQDEGQGLHRWLWVVAAALAYSVLLRPEQVLFVAAVLSAMLWTSLTHRGRRIRPFRAALPTLAAALCVALPLLLWTARNEHSFHVFQPLAPRYANDPGELAPLGFARWYRTWAIDFASTVNVYWNYSGVPIALTDVPDRAFNAGSRAGSQDLRSRTARLLADYNATASGAAVVPSLDARFAALGRERIDAHPFLYYAALPLARVLDMTLRPRTEMMPIPLEWWKRDVPRPQAHFAIACAALNLAYILLGIAGFFVWKRRVWLAPSLQKSPPLAFRELALAMAASLVLRAALLLTIDNSEPRYTLEFFPVLFVFAGALFTAAPRAPLEPPSMHQCGGR